ncbi:MAG: hypothetical protein IPK58_25345 [Acidobacteria bacterium]|nr:hypothetical protein [Acidobacteriota bacterium]
MTDSNGELRARRDFLPFGEEIPAGVGDRTSAQRYFVPGDDIRKKFATYQRDSETNLDYAQSRYYSPMLGRFTSPDEFKGGPDELFEFRGRRVRQSDFLRRYHESAESQQIPVQLQQPHIGSTIPMDIVLLYSRSRDRIRGPDRPRLRGCSDGTRT